MIAFLDSSALAKRYLREPGTDEVLGWMDRHPVVISRLAQVEIASALARLTREESLTREAAEAAYAALVHDVPHFDVVELSASVTHRAMALLREHPLRSLDAIQLASCIEFTQRSGLETTLITYDRRLAEIARLEGVLVVPD